MRYPCIYPLYTRLHSTKTMANGFIPTDQPTNSFYPNLEELINGWTPATNNGGLQAPWLHGVASFNNNSILPGRLTARPWKMVVGRRSFPIGFWYIFQGRTDKLQGCISNGCCLLLPTSPIVIPPADQAWTKSSPPKAKTSAFLILGGGVLWKQVAKRSLVIALGGYSWLRYIHIFIYNRNQGSIYQVCEPPTLAHNWTFNTWNGRGLTSNMCCCLTILSFLFQRNSTGIHLSFLPENEQK